VIWEKERPWRPKGNGGKKRGIFIYLEGAERSCSDKKKGGIFSFNSEGNGGRNERVPLCHPGRKGDSCYLAEKSLSMAERKTRKIRRAVGKRELVGSGKGAGKMKEKKAGSARPADRRERKASSSNAKIEEENDQKERGGEGGNSTILKEGKKGPDQYLSVNKKREK